MKYAFLNLGTVSTHFLPDKNSHDWHPHFNLRVRTDVYVPVGRLLTINNLVCGISEISISSWMFKQRQFESCAKSSQPKATKIVPFLLPRLECRMIGSTENTLELELTIIE